MYPNYSDNKKPQCGRSAAITRPLSPSNILFTLGPCLVSSASRPKYRHNHSATVPGDCRGDMPGRGRGRGRLSACLWMVSAVGWHSMRGLNPKIFTHSPLWPPTDRTRSRPRLRPTACLPCQPQHDPRLLFAPASLETGPSRTTEGFFGARDRMCECSFPPHIPNCVRRNRALRHSQHISLTPLRPFATPSAQVATTASISSPA